LNRGLRTDERFRREEDLFGRKISERNGIGTRSWRAPSHGWLQDGVGRGLTLAASATSLSHPERAQMRPAAPIALGSCLRPVAVLLLGRLKLKSGSARGGLGSRRRQPRRGEQHGS
jgi:hypothetical protein